MSKAHQKLSENFKNAPAEMLQKIGQFRADAIKDIEAVQSDIDRKCDEMAEINRSVCLEVVAALIERSIHASLDNRRAKLYHAASAAKFLTHHADVRMPSGTNGDGRLTFSDGAKRSIDVLSHYSEPLDVLALVWGDKEIRAFAEGAALAAGAKPAPDGLTVEDALERSKAVLTEIESLEETRQQAVAVLNELAGVSLYQFAKKAEKAAVVLDQIASAPTPAPSAGPSVKVRGADGVMRPYQADPFAWRGD